MLADIKKNIERLIALYEREHLEKEKLQAALAASQTENEACRKQIADLERQVDNLKLAEAFSAPAGDGSAAKERIDKLIREMDKAITLLER